MDVNVKDQDVLLVREKGRSELHVANTDKDGKVKSAKLNGNGDNPDFLRIDRHGNLLENFFDNFKHQVKEPTRFEFFRVPAERLQEVVQKLQEAFKNPNKTENKAFLDLHRIDPEDLSKKQAQGKTQPHPQEQTPEKNYAINPNLVKWDKLEQFGITRETLEKSGNLDKLLNYRKTDLVTIAIKIDDTTPLRTDARFSLRRQEDGSFVPAVHPIRHKPDLERPYFGVTFSEDDKQNLLKTGNLGRVVEAEYKQGEKTPIVLSLDKLTNELVAVRTDRIRIPETIKGVTLGEQQKKDLSEGKSVYLENMMSKKDTPFSAYLQFNADKRGFEFRFDNDRRREHSQTQNYGQKDIQKTFRGKELTEDQRNSLSEGKTVYVDGLVDKKGKGYSGYITLNKESGKTDFMFPKQYKDALTAGKVIPDDRHKTQVAVNSEGKSSEATKKIDTSLEKGQIKPTTKQAEQQVKKAEKRDEKKEVKKSRGRKI